MVDVSLAELSADIFLFTSLYIMHEMTSSVGNICWLLSKINFLFLFTSFSQRSYRNDPYSLHNNGHNIIVRYKDVTYLLLQLQAVHILAKLYWMGRPKLQFHWIDIVIITIQVIIIKWCISRKTNIYDNIHGLYEIYVIFMKRIVYIYVFRIISVART